jgi:DNA-binding SARP family transcriptional activator
LSGPERGTRWLIARPRLDDLYETACLTRCTAIVAGPGFGKSTLVETWAEVTPAAIVPVGPADRAFSALSRRLTDALRLRVPTWGPSAPPEARTGPDIGRADDERAESLAAALVGSLSPHLNRPILLVVDDVDALAGSEGARLLDAIVRQAPPLLPVVLVGRSEPPVRLARLRVRGDVLDLGPDELALTVDETTELSELVTGDPSHGAGVHAVTGGWPVAARLALETLREDPTSAFSPDASEGRLFSYLAEELLEAESEEDRSLISTLAHLGPASVDLLEALGFENAGERLAALARRGMYVEYRTSQASVIPLVAQFLQGHDPIPLDSLTDLRRRAATWSLDRAEPVAALAYARAAADEELVQRIIIEAGPSLIANGAAAQVVESAGSLGETDARIDRVIGEALQATGDWDGALRVYSRSLPKSGPVDPGFAWRIGLIHYFRGELDLAVASFERGAEGDPTDRAMLLGWWAAATWVTGDAAQCRLLAGEALATALDVGDDAALAVAYTARALLAAMEGDRRANEMFYLRALDHATKAGDVLQQIRIHVNRGSRLLEEGSFESCIDECDVALHLADLSGYMALRALATSNRARAWLGLGRLDQAAADFDLARSIWERLGSRQIAYALAGAGDVALLRGNRVLARSSYEEAVAVMEPVGDLQGLVPAKAGLARVLVDDDPDAALRVARSAVDDRAMLAHVDALLALGEVHIARGEPAEALAAAGSALEMARSRRDRAGIAHAIELSALAGGSENLSEAVRIWGELGDPLGRARARLRMVQVGEAGPEHLSSVVETLRDLGARRLLGEATALLAVDEERPAVSIHCLGGFNVTVGGASVPIDAWQSKKARDLLKVLVARRGRAVHREELVEILWPDDDPRRTANRLSVALSVVRSVLSSDGDQPQDDVLVTDRSTVRLATERVGIDLEEFHSEVASATAAVRDGDDDLARSHYRRAESLYVGDLCEDNPYEEWIVAERELARSAYLDAARWLANDASSRGLASDAVRFTLRVLQRDPYDEQAYLNLVAGLAADRRHGEARRLYGQYCTRMAEIGIEAAPFPD